MSPNKKAVPSEEEISDSTLNSVLNWITKHPVQFGCGITWLTETRYGPVPGSTEESHGFPDGHEAYRKEPWVAWFLLPTQLSRFRMVRAVSATEAKLALIRSGLGCAPDLNGSELLACIERKAADTGTPSPFAAPGERSGPAGTAARKGAGPGG